MISESDYFFYEWLIIYHHLDFEKFSRLSDDDFKKLQTEFIDFSNKLNQ
ncbi:hypothetical protein GKZ28_09125 [Clostridium chromiireducens]|uniref:Uncharacterized protein n=1 Tax=Clostridium chromiireducens TaxID=225345 RepID=A0A964RLX5_9CLOT|nr:hypothetical protein [Clostridium chromiireducens]MVX63855.1 hypothetical protein [Clostridium chromiireducens]